MAKRRQNQRPAGDAGERSEPQSPAGPDALRAQAVSLPLAGTAGQRYTAQEKAQALREFAASGLGMRAWCKRRGMSTATLCAWRRAYSQHGLEGLVLKRRKRSPKKPTTGGPHRQYTPEERRAAIDAFEKSGMTRESFSRLWGVSPATLSGWLRAYRERGPKGLESPWGGKRRGRQKKPVPAVVREEIVAVKQSRPWFGLRRIRDELARVLGVRVGLHQVRQVVAQEKLPSAAPKKKVRRAPPRPRRFERARPRELWQSDITSYVLTRHSQRVYLTVFLDDHSRYIVSWALMLQQRSNLVCESLLAGIARFGKPKEVLTDQGRQYFAWRGKSRFQKLLIREGIAHVVARTHHPQTLGKCERLWQTVGNELWMRARPQDLDEARRRLGHFFDHYNHFRPHQGIGGLVPAERFFEVGSEARAVLERQMDANSLRLALGEAPRRPVFLYGRIGGEAVSLHGERGRLVIQHEGGQRREISMDALGGAGGQDAGTSQSVDQSASQRVERSVEQSVEQSVAVPEPAKHIDQGPSATAPVDRAPGAQDEGPGAGPGAGAVGEREYGASGDGARGGAAASGVLAGGEEQSGGVAGAGRDAASCMATEPRRDVRLGVRSAAAAALERRQVDEPRGPERGPQGAQEASGGGGERTGGGEAADQGAADASGQRSPRGGEGEEEAEAGQVVAEEASAGRGERRVATRQVPGGQGPPGRVRTRRGEATAPAPLPSAPPSTAVPESDSTAASESAWESYFDAWERDVYRGLNGDAE